MSHPTHLTLEAATTVRSELIAAGVADTQIYWDKAWDWLNNRAEHVCVGVRLVDSRTGNSVIVQYDGSLTPAKMLRKAKAELKEKSSKTRAMNAAMRE